MVLYEIMNRIVESYDAVIDGLENDLDSVEAKVLGGNTGVSSRVHALSREVVRFHQATKPLAGSLEQLMERRLKPSTPSRAGICATSTIRCSERRSRSRDCEIYSLASST
jgi:magnesium transporter